MSTTGKVKFFNETKGYARYAAPGGFGGTLQLCTTADLHPDVDNDVGVHGLILRGLQKIAGP